MQSFYKPQLLKLLTAVFILSVSHTAITQQNYINQKWNFEGNEFGQNHLTKATINSNGNILSINNELNSGNSDIHLRCHSDEGILLWESNCGSSSTLDDYGIDVTTDSGGNVYICAARSNGNNLDYYIAKYSSTGVLVWDQIYNGSDNLDDAPAGLVVSNNSVYVTGATISTTEMGNYTTLKLSASNGSLQWMTTENMNFHQAPTSIKEDNNGNILVAGTSFSNQISADIFVVKYNANNGALLAQQTIVSQGSGHDIAYNMDLDSQNNLFLAGTVTLLIKI